MITIRKATTQDHDALVKLAKESKYTKDFSNAVMFSSPAAYEKGWILVAEDESGQPIGLSCVRHKSREPKTMLYFLIVYGAARNSGVARKLLEQVMASSPHRIMQLNVMKENPALSFYQRLGFEVVGEAIGGSAWQMEKEYKK